MPIAVSTITQTGQVSIPKVMREILGVSPHDQVQFVSDGERVQLLAVPEDPLTLGTSEQFWERVAQTADEYKTGAFRLASEVSADMRERHGL